MISIPDNLAHPLLFLPPWQEHGSFLQGGREVIEEAINERIKTYHIGNEVFHVMFTSLLGKNDWRVILPSERLINNSREQDGKQ